MQRTPDQVVGQLEEALHPPELVARWRSDDLHVLATGNPVEYEEVYAAEDGAHTYLSIKFPILNAEGAIHAIGVIATDITARTQAEEALRKSEAVLRAIINATSDTVIGMVTPDGHIALANEAFARILGMTPATIVGKHLNELYPPDVAMSRLQGMRGILATQTPMRFEGEVDGRWYDEIAFPVATPDRGIIGVGVMSRDISDRRQMEEELRQRMQTLDALRATLNELSGNLNLNTLLHTMLERAVSLLGATMGALSLYDAEHNDLRVVVSLNTSQDYTGMHIPLGKGASGQVALTRQPVVIQDYQTWEQSLCSDVCYEAQTTLAVPLLAGDALVGVIMVTDTENRRTFGEDAIELLTLFAQQSTIAIQNARLFAEVQQLAATDSLLAIHTRRHFFVLARAALEQLRRLGHPLAVIMLDIDNFKRINDTYGHAAGDKVLRCVADECRATVRTRDLLGRYGGEEIVVLLPETDHRAAALVAERLRRNLSQMDIPINGHMLHITVSLGVAAVICNHDVELERLIDQADQSMYAAKQAGKDRVVVWGEETLSGTILAGASSGS